MKFPLTGVLVAALAGCSDYNLHGKDTPPPVGDTAVDSASEPEDSAAPPVGQCDSVDAPAIEVALNDTCDIPPQTGTFTPVVEWEVGGLNGYGPPAIGQLTDDNGDGQIDAADTPDIALVANNASGLYVLDGATGTIEWKSTDVRDALSVSAIGDLDGDGFNEVVSSSGTSTIVALDHTGKLLWKTSVSERVGTASLNSSLTPAIADMDGDGYAEVIAGHTILDHDGNVLGEGKYGVGSCPNASSPTYLEGSIAVPVDTDLDGELEVVVGNAIYDMNGNALATNSLPDGTVAVADFDGDGFPEFVVNSENHVYTLNNDLSLTGWSDTFNNTNYVGPIAIDDLDGDGQPDFVAVGSGELRAYHWDGTRIWTAKVHDSSGAAGPILYDFENDGYPEVVYADETDLYVFNGLDGTIKLDSTDHDSATLFETPVVADVDGDGEVEIIMEHGSGAHGISVFGDAGHTWPPGRKIWNQHAYSITNVNDDGTIPAYPVPNWTEYNNFRSGDAGLPPSSWNDVQPEVVDVCTEECPDRLVITVRVWNQGTEEVAAGLPLVVRAGPEGAAVATATVPDPIASGWSSAGIEITVKSADLGGEPAFVDVDRDASLGDTLDECVEDNNENVVDTTCG